MTAAVDRDAVHTVFWLRAHPVRRTVRIPLEPLAEELHVTRWTAARLVARMVDEGRLVPVGTAHKSAMYKVNDPKERG